MENLQAKLRGSDASSQGGGGDGDAAQPGSDGGDAQPETLVLRAQLLSAGRERHKESNELKEKHEEALAASREEIHSLKAEVERRSQEVGEMKQKVQQANRENVEMMDTWKVREISHIHREITNTTGHKFGVTLKRKKLRNVLIFKVNALFNSMKITLNES